jgi:membrane protein YdbS with pleckstrin-like domain
MTDASRPQLRPPRNTLDPRAQAWWRAQGLLAAIPVLIGVCAVIVLFPTARPWSWIVLAIIVVWSLVEVFVAPAWRMRIHRWEVTDEAVYAAAGWWTQEWRIAPVSRIQTVDTIRGPLQRRFGLSSVTVTTASAAGPIRIDGLDAQLADDLVHRLTLITHAADDDAT